MPKQQQKRGPSLPARCSSLLGPSQKRDVEYLKYVGLGGLPPTHPLLCSAWDLFIPLFPPLSRPPQKKYLYQLFASTTTQKKANKLKMHRLGVTRGGGTAHRPGYKAQQGHLPAAPYRGRGGPGRSRAKPSRAAPAAPCPGGAARLGAASAPR